MEDLEFYVYVPNPEKKYDLTSFEFSERELEDQVDECTLDNDDFLEESTVVSGLSELSKVPEDKIASLLKGEIDISEIPEFEHTVGPKVVKIHQSVIQERDRINLDDYYYYKLQNGVFIFGLNATHHLIHSLQSGVSPHGLKVTFDPDLISSIRTQSRGKRRRNKELNLSKICEISCNDKIYSVHIPNELSRYEVIEINSRLLDEPELLVKKEGWLAILLDKDKTIRNKKDMKNKKKPFKRSSNK